MPDRVLESLTEASQQSTHEAPVLSQWYKETEAQLWLAPETLLLTLDQNKISDG